MLNGLLLSSEKPPPQMPEGIRWWEYVTDNNLFIFDNKIIDIYYSYTIFTQLFCADLIILMKNYYFNVGTGRSPHLKCQKALGGGSMSLIQSYAFTHLTNGN